MRTIFQWLRWVCLLLLGLAWTTTPSFAAVGALNQANGGLTIRYDALETQNRGYDAEPLRAWDNNPPEMVDAGAYFSSPAQFNAAKGSGSSVTNLKNWWNAGAENDMAWRALPLKDKVFYEVGQKTLPNGVWQKYANLDPVARGRNLVQDKGWLGALRPQGAGWKLGAGETLQTGPTPLVRWAVPRAAGTGTGAVGGTGYYLYNRENE